MRNESGEKTPAVQGGVHWPADTHLTVTFTEGAVMQFKPIAATLVCVSLALAAHYAFAGLSANKCDGKLCSNYAAGGGLLKVTVENLSRIEYTDVNIDVFVCTSSDQQHCSFVAPSPTFVGTLTGG